LLDLNELNWETNLVHFFQFPHIFCTYTPWFHSWLEAQRISSCGIFSVFSPHSLALISAFTRAGRTVGAAVTLFGFVHAIWQQNRTKPSVRIVPVLPPPAAAKRNDRQRPKKHAPERKTAVQISSKGGKKSQVVVAVCC